MHDQLRVPDVPPGECECTRSRAWPIFAPLIPCCQTDVLGLRYDCEASAQVWNSCADVVITAKADRAAL